MLIELIVVSLLDIFVLCLLKEYWLKNIPSAAQAFTRTAKAAEKNALVIEAARAERDEAKAEAKAARAAGAKAAKAARAERHAALDEVFKIIKRLFKEYVKKHYKRILLAFVL